MMMQIKDAILFLSSVRGVIKDIKNAANTVAVVSLGFLKITTNKKLNELQEKIGTLENKVNSGFPQLKSLILSYSEIKTSVAIARALADKMAELAAIAPSVIPSSTVVFVNQAPIEFNQVVTKLHELPGLDTSEAGELFGKLDNIEKLLMRLQYIVDQGGMSNIENKSSDVTRIFREISNNYAGIEAKLAKLINQKILSGFDSNS
ncbi:hypothetical protein VB620_15220 [Nodularia harveyana UHCC-0300]|uniref:Uncharacterized protein n=1 Tax=Nodularia harveyana UHCC-0300 TaxID=2974287 RepID=A0ABU5UGP2_9CYAN|nr:hypothetical protein [Nodularia harveyana]MEA5582689.1 hypothetical protein [Nodularia harveyana UHCC-0300]